MQDSKRRGTLIQQTPSEVAALEKHGFNLTVKLGQGGYGKVYLADYTSAKKGITLKLACKIIDFSKSKESDSFIRNSPPHELKILTKLRHPYIIEIHSIFQRKLKYFIFMRYAENGDLLDFILNNGPLKETLAKIWIRQLCLALQYLHTLNIAHRDIKCENILITSTNHVKLADFGFARSILDANNQEELSETYCGSLSYASPQILQGEPYHPKATDMWSFGCVIYVMLNKSFPFETKNMKTVINDQLLKNFKFRSKYVSRYTAEAVALVGYLLDPDEGTRYQIEDVLNSSWIAMDPKLKILSKREFSALAQAKIIADNTVNDFSVHIIQSRKISYTNTENNGFDLNLVRDSINNNTNKRLSA